MTIQMNKCKLVPVEPTPEMIDAAREHHEGEAYLPVSVYKAMIAAAPAVQRGVPEETINAVISLVKDAASTHLNSEFNLCLSKIRKLLYTAPQPEIAALKSDNEELRQMLDAEQEPVAWIVRHPRFYGGKFTDDKEIAAHWESKKQGCTTPLFHHSQQKKT